MPGRIVQIVKDNKPRGLRMNVWLALVVAILVAIPLICVVVFWGQIREAAMDPATPFQTQEPSPAPDYADPKAWALYPAAGEPDTVDVFFIHPTTHQGRRWNAAVDNKDANRRLKTLMAPNYAGPFGEVGRVFAPHYRQASLYTQITLREDARDARAFAYQDIKAAFDHYLSHWKNGHPVIIVGVEQGGLLASRLSAEVMAEHPDAARWLVAVYLLEAFEPAGRHGQTDALPACRDRSSTGCVVAYLATAPGEEHLLRSRIKHAPMWSGDHLVPFGKTPILCVNPMTGSRDGSAPGDLNLGAANASGLEWGTAPGPQSHQVSAECKDGVLQVTKPSSASLRGRASWADAMRVRPYNWFYADLTADAKARVAAFSPLPPAPLVSSQTAR